MKSYNYLLENHLKYPDMPLCIQKGFHDKAFHTHSHDFGELVIVMEGSAVHTVLDKSYTIQEGDVFVINGPLSHGFKEADKLSLFNIMYDYQNPIFDKPSLRALSGYQSLFTIGPKIRGTESFKSWANLRGEDRDIAKQLVTSLYNEYENQREGHRDMLLALLHQIIIHLSRCYTVDSQADQKRLIPLARAIAFMEDNYANSEVMLRDIADKSCTGIRQLDRLFNRYMSRPPIQYLTEIRLQHSADILRYRPNVRITDVAFQCGFSDPNYFTRTFRKRFSMSPSEFRKAANPKQ